MQNNLCHHCRQYNNKTQWPQRLSDYPNCWQIWEEGRQFLRKNKKDTLCKCSLCNSLWLVTWNYRKVFLEANQLPEELHIIFEKQNTLNLIWQLLIAYNDNRHIQSFIFNIAKKHFIRGELNQSCKILVDFLSDTSLPIKNADIAISLLHTILGTAARKACSEKSENYPQNLTILSGHLYRTTNYSMIASDKWRQTGSTANLPPIHNLDITPLTNWLEVLPDRASFNEIINLRCRIRDFLIKLALQLHRHCPVLSLTGQSYQLVEDFHNRKKWLTRLIRQFKHYANKTNIDNLSLMDDLVQLEQLLAIQKELQADTALNLITIAENIQNNKVKYSYPLLKKIDKILSITSSHSNYPAKVQQRLNWFIRTHLNQK